MTATVDGSAIVVNGGGFVRFATDLTEWRVRTGTVGSAFDSAVPMQQVIQWCAPSSTRDSILLSLRSAGFTVKQIGGSREFVGQCRGSSAVPANLPLTFWEARSS
jgi:hypothetical protein